MKNAIVTISDDNQSITLVKDDGEQVGMKVKDVILSEHSKLKTCSNDQVKFVSQKDFKELFGLGGSEARRLHTALRNKVGRLMARMAASETNGMIAVRYKKKYDKDGDLVEVTPTYQVEKKVPKKKTKKVEATVEGVQSALAQLKAKLTDEEREALRASL